MRIRDKFNPWIKEIFQTTLSKLENASTIDEQFQILNQLKISRRRPSSVIGKFLESNGFDLKRISRNTFEYYCTQYSKMIHFYIGIRFPAYGFNLEDIKHEYEAKEEARLEELEMYNNFKNER